MTFFHLGAEAEKLPIPASAHAEDCEWHFEQYPWECDCGAIADPESRRPAWLGVTPA